MAVWIKTERGKVRVVERSCATRECLHVHWSRHPSERTDRRDGARVEVYPLVCIRNEEHGCPTPKPVPR